MDTENSQETRQSKPISNIMKEKKYEYLDHTADIQFHAWGADLKEAFEQTSDCMFNYMTDADTIEIDESMTQTIEVEGHDLCSLLFAFMDEILFNFCADFFVVKECRITEFDMENFKIKAETKGELWDKNKHPQGTEIKAITYSNMQVFPTDKGYEIFVIVDI